MKEKKYRNPIPTVDIIILFKGKIILIERKNKPFGWAIPGGFVDYGENFEDAAVREAKEETGLDVKLIEQFHSYSSPDRDPRQHTVTTVYIANGFGIPKADDDAINLGFFDEETLPNNIVFDHREIIADYYNYTSRGIRKKI